MPALAKEGIVLIAFSISHYQSLLSNVSRERICIQCLLQYCLHILCFLQGFESQKPCQINRCISGKTYFHCNRILWKSKCKVYLFEYVILNPLSAIKCAYFSIMRQELKLLSTFLWILFLGKFSRIPKNKREDCD